MSESNTEVVVDRLKVISGEPIVISDLLTIYQPTIRQISRMGEQKFLNTVWSMCSCAWDMPSAFDDMGIDFMSVPDWEFFRQTVRSFGVENTKLIFGDLDFSKLQPMEFKGEDNTEPQIVLVNLEPITVNGKDYEPLQYFFTEDLYKKAIPYVREMIGFTHKGRKAGNRATAKILIMDDRRQRERHKNDPYESMFHNGIISLVNTEEFPYTYDTVLDLTVYQFTKSLIQIQGKKQACAMLQGSMSGFVDTSKIPSSSFQWTYSDEKYNKRHGRTLKESLAPNGGNLNVKPMNQDIPI
jgi:hypothetical protein